MADRTFFEALAEQPTFWALAAIAVVVCVASLCVRWG